MQRVFYDFAARVTVLRILRRWARNRGQVVRAIADLAPTADVYELRNPRAVTEFLARVAFS